MEGFSRLPEPPKGPGAVPWGPESRVPHHLTGWYRAAMVRPGRRRERPGSGLAAREQSLPCGSNTRRYPRLPGQAARLAGPRQNGGVWE